MHILESYALQNDLKIDRAEVYEKFFPLAVDKFITLDTDDLDTSAMLYDHWNLVVQYLSSRLNDHGIKIVQLGSKKSTPIPGCYQATGQCDFNQQSYIIKKSLLHLTVNNQSSHVASSFGKKLVVLFPYNCYTSQFRPYWSQEDDITILQGTSEHSKPSFSPSESPKSINNIKPEKIAKAVLEALNLYDNKDPVWQYETVKVGLAFNRRRIETNLTDIIDCKKLGVSSIIARMDFNFNEDILEQQLNYSQCSIITSKPISEKIINKYHKNILELVYYIPNDHSPDFVKNLKSKKINYILRSRMSEQEVNDLKLDYLDYGMITRIKPKSQNDFPELKGKNNLYYKSNYLIIHNSKFYPNTAALSRLQHGSETIWADNGLQSLEQELQPVIDDPYFWEEVDHFHIFEKK